MLSWYDRSCLLDRYPSLYTEAGAKENLFFALLTALLTGTDLAVLNRVSNKTGVPVEVLSTPRTDDIWEEVEELLEKKKNDPKIQTMIEQSKLLAEEVKKETSEAVTPQKASTELDDIARAVIAIEGASANHVGPSGDTGVMQLLPATWKEMNRLYFNSQYPYREYAKNPTVNILFGKKYLEHIKKFLDANQHALKGDPLFLMFACYNGGMGNVQRLGFDPKMIEMHIPRVFDYATRAMNLLG